MAIKSDNTKGNPYHQEGTGKFTSADSSGESTTETITQPMKIDLSGLFTDDSAEGEDLGALLNEIESENANKPKPVTEMSTQELLSEIKTAGDKIINDYGCVCDQGFTEVFGHDLQLACANVRQIENVLSTYDIHVSGMEIVGKRIGSYVVAQISATRQGDRLKDSLTQTVNVDLMFNSARYTSYNNLKALQSQQQELKFSVQADEEHLVSKSATHELGHALFNNLYIEDVRNANPDIQNENINSGKIIRFTASEGKSFFELSSRQFLNLANKKEDRFFESCRKEIYQVYQNDNPDNQMSYKEFIGSVSGYGKTHVSEWLAECFASLNCGKPTKIANAMYKYLEQKGKVRKHDN